MNELEDIVELGSTGLISPNPESLVILNQCSFEIIEFSVNDSQNKKKMIDNLGEKESSKMEIIVKK